MPTSSCPDCHEDVYVDADCEQGDTISCEECGSKLEVVGLDPIELDLKTVEDPSDYDIDKDFDSYGYDDQY